MIFGHTLKIPGTNEREFDLLAKVAQCVMTIPHSNASEERIFSLINKNKTSSRSSLQADNTLLSLITVKTHIEDPLKWNPSEVFFKRLRKRPKHTISNIDADIVVASHNDYFVAALIIVVYDSVKLFL